VKKQTQLIPARMLVTAEHDTALLQLYGWESLMTGPGNFSDMLRGYRVLCGFGHTWGTGHPCAGTLGKAIPLHRDTTDFSHQLEMGEHRKDMLNRLFEMEDCDGWYLEHPERLRGDDGVYRVMSDIPQGRRPLPRELRPLPPIAPELAAPSKDMVGDLAVLPLTIECPRCRRLNRVTLPDDAATLKPG
jgi:hypothetical protein